jgi:lipid-binding SYLF domain-containing protein
MAWLVTLLVALIGIRSAQADDPQLQVDRARLVVDEMRGDATFGSADLLLRARAVMIVPELSKGGLLIGGQGGAGLLLARQSDGSWSAPAFYSLGGATFGLQVGFQTAKMVFFVMSDAALETWLRGDFKFGTQDGVAVFIEGSPTNRQTSQGADVIAWARANGAYAGITIEGTDVSFNVDATRAYYGRIVGARELLLEGAAAPRGADGLRLALAAR